MKEIKAWETSDDMIFDSKKDARIHQRFIDFKRSAENFVEKHMCHENDKDDVLRMLLEHRRELYDMLKKAED